MDSDDFSNASGPVRGETAPVTAPSPLSSASNAVLPPSTRATTATPSQGPLPQYFVIRSTDVDESGNRPPLKLNPFQIEDALSRIGHPTDAFRNRDGAIEVRFTREIEIKKVMSTKQLTYRVHGKGVVSTPVEVVQHPKKNSVQGVITCHELSDLTEEEIVEGLSRDGVVHVKHIMRTVNRKRVNTGTVILTFNGTQLPSRVHVGYLTVNVRTYVPDPIRCYKCQSFGHLTVRCNKDMVCAKCSCADHESNDCASSEAKCPNCSGKHPAWSRKCPTFLMEKEILTIRVKHEISYREAKRRYAAQHPTRSYREVASQLPPPREVGTITRGSSRTRESLPPPPDPGSPPMGLDAFKHMSVGAFLNMILSTMGARRGAETLTDISTAISAAAVPPRPTEALPGPATTEPPFTLVGKAGKPVNTRRGGPPPATMANPRDNLAAPARQGGPPPDTQASTRISGSQNAGATAGPPLARPARTMGPPPPPSRKPTGSRPTSPAQAISSNRRRSQSPVERRRTSLPSSPAPGKRSLMDTTSPGEADQSAQRQQARQRVRVEAPARGRSESASPARRAADFFHT